MEYIGNIYFPRFLSWGPSQDEISIKPLNLDLALVTAIQCLAKDCICFLRTPACAALQHPLTGWSILLRGIRQPCGESPVSGYIWAERSVLLGPTESSQKHKGRGREK